MRIQLCSTLVVALTLFCLPLVGSAQANTSQDEKTSQTEKAKKCDHAANKLGLKGDNKAAYVSTCLAGKDTAAATMSPEEKAKVGSADTCEQQATQKGLKGKDRKAFIKTCTGSEAAPK